MAANGTAPYYQVRRQFTNGTNAQFAPDDDYDLSASVTPNNASLYADAPNTDSTANTLEENHHLVELLEAATTAAGQAAEAMNIDSAGASVSTQTGGKRKRVSSSPTAEGSHDAAVRQEDVPSDPKRPRIDMPTDPTLHGPENNRRAAFTDTLHPSSETLLSDARAASVHSAAALFRRSSKETSRKYTRPPMSKLFISLQLTPENFLHLQAQAKIYMLDPSHPERQSCVGNRGKGDTDMVKLRLFNCVRDFLNDGLGEQFFGEHVEKPGERDAMEAARALGEEKGPSEGKLVWPRDGNKIISLVTPLLRRMVTNERQRMYAIETRKGGAKRKEGSVESPQTLDNELGMEGFQQHHQQEQEQEQLQRTLVPASTPPPQALAPRLHSHPPSPISTTPLTHSNIVPISPLSTMGLIANELYGPRAMAGLNARLGRTLKADEHDLPLASEHKPHTINICLSKAGIALPEAHLSRKNPAIFSQPLTTALQPEISTFVELAISIYPALMFLGDKPPPAYQGMGPEALRGLAVAASEMNADGELSERATDGSAPGSPAIGTAMQNTQNMQNTPAVKIRYSVHVLTSAGLKQIRGQDGRWNENAWDAAKQNVSKAVWAAGVMTVVVDTI